MSKSLWWIGCFFIILHLSSFWVSGIDDFNQAFPIIEPDPGHTKLRLSSEGLEAIRRITNPIAAVAVIGPYRSGKSFLLNQLLSLSCYEGFGVGHMRDTKTKGIWVWGTPVEMDIDGVKTSVFYLDTEGFESIGKSNVYDDRIFALATVLSSVLIYNLPETIREADISRLSFAVELAEEFYGRVKGQDVAFEPAKLLWLIQRDFLQGKSVKEMVDEALRHVPNHDGDRNIDQVNQIRDSLAIMGDNSTAFSLPQMFKNFVMANQYQSSKLCEALYTKCEDQMDQLQVLRLPSMAKFNAGFLHCNQSFGKECVGPSKTIYEQRMVKMMGKSKSSFIKEYNHRLFNWLVAFSLVMVIVGRFIIKFILIEIGAWILFIFLETYTRMFWSPESLYYNPVWHGIVATWETLVYSPVLDLDRWAIQIGFVSVVLLVYWRCCARRKHKPKHGPHSVLPLYNNASRGRDRSE
ncbi:guanylate-binding protein 4 isoform X4 [Helianthus annuus]|uniref:guanylate-binding protein 4 isoform X4 n=1 Tax=Helianthus annuus TaxID=4232 RepID=UPI00165312CB|nr:guanylate-binding protein 4 isoform X4 [Helianthus annuus]